VPAFSRAYDQRLRSKLLCLLRKSRYEDVMGQDRVELDETSVALLSYQP
jgi:hypothetical protein